MYCGRSNFGAKAARSELVADDNCGGGDDVRGDLCNPRTPTQKPRLMGDDGGDFYLDLSLMYVGRNLSG